MAHTIKGQNVSVRRLWADRGQSLHEWLPRVTHQLRVIGPNLLMLLGLILVPALALLSFIPPSVVSSSAPASAFSAERALPHLQVIAQQPRPVGSAANARVRDYLLQQLTAMGFQPEVQKTAIVSGVAGAAATVQNLLVRIPGTAPTQAVLITAHYDSVLNGPGTGDNGVSVAAMLETLRALQAGDALRNDLIFLFNDGEEPGLLGAQAFVEEHPWAQDVGVVFDFDADGPIGRTITGWTTAEDGWLVDEMANSSAGIVASSTDNVEKRGDRGNDLHVFAAAGITGAHINVVAGSTRYHSTSDSLANLDQRRLQDHGNAMLALARHFGDLQIGETKAGNVVFFTTFGTTILHYPAAWALPLTLVVALGLVAIIALGLWRHRLTARGLGLALLAVTTGVIVLAGLSQLIWQPILATHPEADVFSERDFYGRGLYLGSLYAATIAIILGAIPWLVRRFTAPHLALVSAGWFLTIILAAGFDPTQSYMVLPPLLATIAVLAVLLFAPESSGGRWWQVARFGVLLFGLVVTAGVTVALFYRAAIDGLEEGPVIVIALLTLLLGLLAPQLALAAQLGRRWLPATGGIIAVGLMLFAITTSGQSSSNPRPDTLMYGLNADRAEAVWVSADSSPDEWTKQVLTDSPVQSTLGDVLGIGSTSAVLVNSAPVVELPAPELMLLGEQRYGDERTLRLRLNSPRQAYRYYLLPGPGVQLLAAGIGDKALVDLETYDLRYEGLPSDGAELTVRVRASGPVQFTVVDQSSGLPQLPGVTLSPRPDTFMAAPGPEWVAGDPTLVWRTVVFE